MYFKFVCCILLEIMFSMHLIAHFLMARTTHLICWGCSFSLSNSLSMRSRSISSVAGGLEYTYLVFDGTPHKKVAQCSVRSGLLGCHSWWNLRLKSLFPNTSWSLCLTLRPLWAEAPSCINQLSRLIFPYASRIDGKILSSSISPYLIPVSVSS